MNRQDKQNAIHLLDLAKARLDKSGWEYSATWEGFTLSAHSAGGSSWRPDPLAGTVDKINREKPTQDELKAWAIVRKLPDVQFDSLFIWHCVKDKIKPKTENRYRLGDLLGLLTWKYYTPISIEHGCRFSKDPWQESCSLAMETLADNYFKVFPEIRVA